MPEGLGLDYSDLFWFCEDLKAHNQMELLAEWKGFSGIGEIFREEEIEVIMDAEKILKSAPVDIKEELRFSVISKICQKIGGRSGGDHARISAKGRILA